MRALLLRGIGLAALALASVQAQAAEGGKDGLDRRGELAASDQQSDDGKYTDTYTIQAQAGDLIELDLSSGAFDPVLRLTGPGGLEVENDDASATGRDSRVLAHAPETGAYTVTVTSFGPRERGRYRLTGRTSPRPLNTALASHVEADLASGDERLDTGEYFDALTFTGREGDLVHLRLSSSAFDPYLIVRGPAGASFDNDDAAPGSTASAINATLPASGEYRVMATSFAPGENGAYVLDVVGAEAVAEPSRAPHIIYGSANPVGDLVLGTAQQGTLDPADTAIASGALFDSYTLTAAPGTRVAVRLSSDDFDTSLAAFGSDGSETSNDDAEGQGTNSRVELVMPVSGTVTLVASSYGAAVKGSYTLLAEAIGTQQPATGTPLALGDTVDGVLEAGERAFLFQATGQQAIDFTLTSDAFDPMLRLTGPAGFTAQNDDDPVARTLNSRITATLPEAGTYRLVVTSYNGEGSGPFTLDASPAPTTAQAEAANGAALAGAATLTLDAAATGNLARTDGTRAEGQRSDSWAFAGTRGQRLTFTMESEAFDTWLSLAMPGGEVLVNDDRAPPEDTDSRVAVTLPQDGTYLVTASAFAADTGGEYTLTVAPADSATRTQAPTSSNARVFALSVGVADYARIEGLPFTDRDAEKLTETLDRLGVLAPQSVTLTNAEATREAFTAALQRIAAEIGPDDLLLVFYSGHGDKVEGVTTEMDGSSETIELYDAALHDWELAEMFAGITARTLLVLDSCFSGGFDQVIDQRVERMGVFSSDADVLSLVADKYQAGGYVSLLLREALEGAADANLDRAITAGEISEYMRRSFYRLALRVPLEAGGEDFSGQESLGYQHLIIDRGGDGMPYGQVLLRLPDAIDGPAQ